MAAITHQDIIDRIEALGVEHGAAFRAERARIDKERKSLQELCGGLGHFFKKGDGLFIMGSAVRYCVFCGRPEAR